jgi:ERCC4-type nuclease
MVHNKRKNQRSARALTTSTRKKSTPNKLAGSVKEGFPPGIAQPALRALAGAGYTSLEQLTKVREADLSKLHGMGPKAIGIIRAALKARGKAFLS